MLSPLTLFVAINAAFPNYSCQGVLLVIARFLSTVHTLTNSDAEGTCRDITIDLALSRQALDADCQDTAYRRIICTDPAGAPL